MIIVAFDIGYRNLAWTIVQYKSDIFQSNSAYIDEQTEGQMIRCMNIIDIDKYDACQMEEKPMEIYKNIHRYLLSKKHVWEKADVFLIEQQMSNGKIYNIKALKISQHILAFFLLLYPEKQIKEFSPNLKSLFFREKFPSKKHLKKWSVTKMDHLIANDPYIEYLISLHSIIFKQLKINYNLICFSKRNPTHFVFGKG